MNYDNYKASYKYCKNILSLDFNTIHSLEKLQKYKVILLDSYRYINDYNELGLIKESLEKGFIVQYQNYLQIVLFLKIYICLQI